MSEANGYIEWEVEYVETTPRRLEARVKSARWKGGPIARIGRWDGDPESAGIHFAKNEVRFGPYRARILSDHGDSWDGYLITRMDDGWWRWRWRAAKFWCYQKLRPVDTLFRRLGWAVGAYKAEFGTPGHWFWERRDQTR
jgi:hypothetical protein